MATLGFMAGAETGGLEEITATQGAPSAQSTTTRTGGYAFLLAGNTTQQLISSGVLAVGHYLVSVGIRFTDLSPATAIAFYRGNSDGGILQVSLRLETNGDLAIVDSLNAIVATATNPFTINTWHYLEFFWEHEGSATATVWVDGTQILTVSAVDLSTGVVFAKHRFGGPTAATDGDIYIDDWTVYTGALAADRLSNGTSAPFAEVFVYQNHKASTAADAGLTPNDSTLGAGNWSNTGETPMSETNVSTYSASGVNGAVLHDDAGSPNGPGPSGGAYTINGTIKGANWIWRLLRGAGAGTTHSIYYGNGTDIPIVASTQELTTSYANYSRLSEAANAVPTSAQVFAAGFGTGGAQDISCAEMWAMLLHQSPAVAADLPPGLGPVVAMAQPEHSMISGALLRW